MATTAPAVKAALLAELQERFEGDVHVQWGLPAELPTRYERVYILNDRDHRRDGTRGNLAVETYVIELLVEVHLNRSPQHVEERAREIEATVQAGVKAIAGSWAVAFVTGDGSIPEQTPEGLLYRCTPTVRVRAV
jgi:hypothetical protein